MEEKRKKLPVILIIIIIVIIGAGAGLYFAMSGGEETADENSETNTGTENNGQAAVNADDPYADLMKYDGKTIDVSSTDGKVTGQVAIAIDKTESYPINVVYFMKVADPLPKTTAATGGDGYYYIANHAKEENLRAGDGTGSFSEAICNPELTPDVLDLAQQRSIDTDIYLGCEAQTDPWHESEVFYHLYSTYYNKDTFDYSRDVIGKDKLAVFDSGPFYEEETVEGYQSWGADNETVIKEGEIVASYDLIFTE